MRIQTRRNIPDATEIRRLHREKGLTFVQIAQRSGLDLESIRSAIGVKKARTSKGEIKRLYFQEGFSFDYISKYLGVSLKTIRRIFRANKWAYRTSTTTKYLDSEWIHHLYYIEGFSKKEIGELLDIHPATVQKLFFEKGWISRQNHAVNSRNFSDSERRETQRMRRQKIKAARDRIFGTKCYACLCEQSSKKSHHLHRKDGTEHDRNLFRSLKQLESLNPNEWVPLCDRCHLGVHMLMKVFGYDWRKIDLFLSGKGTTIESKEVLELPSDTMPYSKEFKALSHQFEGNKDDLKKALFGESCSLCGSIKEKESMTLHRKDGKVHHPAMTTRVKHIRKLVPSNWAYVCHDCHIIAQWALDKLGIDWLEVTKRLKKEQSNLL